MDSSNSSVAKVEDIRNVSVVSELTPRERWIRAMHFQTVDRIPNEEFGYWRETSSVWHKQGLPKYVNLRDETNRFDMFKEATKYFGLDDHEMAPINMGLVPEFEYKLLEEDNRHKIIINESGVKCAVKRNGTSSIPYCLEFPVKDRRSWNEFKKRLNPDTAERYPDNWNELVRAWRKRNYPLGINCGSLFGWLRDWMGFERATTMFYDDSALIEDMMEYLTYFIMSTMKKALLEVEFDFAIGWEDMAFNKGPMISPALFRKYMVPRYKRITEFLNRHGVDIICVDCDGNINELVELWLDAGINCMLPLEINSGTDPVVLRKKHGDKILLQGGVNKLELKKGKREIENEIKRIEKTVLKGGYIPYLDHRCPPDVPYKNYLYYLKIKRNTFGIR